MKLKFLFSMLLIILFIICCAQDPIVKEYPKSVSLTLNNTGGPDRIDQAVILNVNDISSKYTDFNPMAFIILDGKKELASQVNDLNEDHQADQIVFVCDLKAGLSKNIILRYAPDSSISHEYTKRTQAELSHKVGGKFVKRVYEGGTFQNVEYLDVPPEHTDHSWYIRYEGPGWESDKVGYRFYLDWRDATDIFGKKTTAMVLQDVGQDGFDSYHEMSDWGMDILKVGDSFGIGTWGMWADGKAYRVSETDRVECTIVENGPVQSKIRTNYFGWKVADKKYDLISTLTINAGSRMTHCELQISGQPENLCTGIVKNDSAEVLKSENSNKEWQYLATYGRQSLADDNLGMVVFFKKSDLISLEEDKLSHLILLKPVNGKADYYFAAAWEKEPNGIISKAQFIDYLNEMVERLDTPVAVSIQK